MLSINAKLTGFAVLALPFVSLSVKYFGDAIHVRFEKIQEQLSELSAVAQETLAGVRVVRAYGQEANEIERFRTVNQAYLDRNRALIRLQGVFYPSMTLFLGLSALVVLWLGSRDVILGRHDARRVRRVQLLSRHVELADDRVRLCDQSSPARHRVVEAAARNSRHAAGHSGCARREARQ